MLFMTVAGSIFKIVHELQRGEKNRYTHHGHLPSREFGILSQHYFCFFFF